MYILFLSENDTALPWDFRIFALQEMPEDYLPCGGLTPLLMAMATGQLVYINEDTPIAGWFMEHHGNSYFYLSGTS